MAIKQLVLGNKLNRKRAELEEMNGRGQALEARAKELKKREEELAQAIEEAETEEEQTAVEAEGQALEQDEAALQGEQEAHDQAVEALTNEIADLERQLEELNNKGQDRGGANPHTPEGQSNGKDDGLRMKNDFYTRAGMNRAQAEAIVAREDVRDFLARTREMMGAARSVTGAELTIPEVMLEILRDNAHRYSKLLSHVTVKNVSGKARQNITGTVPEAVWTEMVATLNELDISFNQVEVDGYKVAGYVVIPNSIKDDSDLDLSAEIMDALGQGIGYATDKAILYGTGTKMPTGIMTRLAQTTKPSDWNTNAPAWVDLHTSNIITINPATLSAEEFFAELIRATGKAKSNYSTGAKFWAMNESTYTELMAKSVTFNSAGAIVSGMNNVMPIVGGPIVTLDFIPNGDIIGGYGSLYLVAERQGTTLAQSEHVKFIEDQTVFRGIARRDGLPVLGEGFVAINIANTAPTTSVAFAPDSANP